MVFVKVRETYDLHTLPNKMTVIGVHTPKNDIIKRNYPGLLMQCKMYRPVRCDIKMACASMLPLDPLGVGTAEGDVAPEDVFNPILYKTVSNKTMDLIEQYINRANDDGWTARGDSIDSTNDGINASSVTSDFDLYYGLLANTHDWKHANPQAGLEMRNVVPLVYEVLYSLGQNRDGNNTNTSGTDAIGPNGQPVVNSQIMFKGNAHPIPFMNCTVPVRSGGTDIYNYDTGFGQLSPDNYQAGVPAPRVMCACLIVPPSRRHQLFYRLVCEWTLEFTSIRPIQEVSNWVGLASVGVAQHVMDYDFSSKVMTEETNMVDTSEDSGIVKVM